MSKKNVLLSIIIICKNEEKFICQCIESIIASTKGFGNKEIILVDSGSKDETLRLACRFNISIAQLQPHWRHTPSAGRYVGFRMSSGEFLLFVDGDCCLMPGFVENAIELFKNRDSIGSIIGRRKEIYYSNGIVVGERRDVNKIPEHLAPIEVTAGPAIYRRSTFERVGSFNPYLFSEEEGELSYRIKDGGYEIIGIPVDMVVHHTNPRESLVTYVSRIRGNLHLGPGQIMRYGLTRGISLRLFKKISSGLHLLAWLFMGLSMFVSSLLWKTSAIFMVWIAATGILYLLFAAKSKNMVKPIRYSIIWTLQSYSIIRGFILKPQKPESYPLNVIHIKHAE
jgi:glycosyltransferase involved in cell wall biosynthesis